MRRTFALILAAVLLLSAAGCTSRTPVEEPPQETEQAAAPAVKPPVTEPPVESAAPTETPEETEPPYRNPFSGAGMEKPLTARPFTVMINNLDAALPHCGVSQADILYEVLAEGGITRMQAVFSDIQSVEKIGPVRSIRPYFLDIALSYGSVIGHAGGSDAAYSRIGSERLPNIDGVRGSYSFNVFYRDPNRLWKGYEHALFTTGENLYKCAQERGYALEVGDGYETGLTFVRDGTPSGGESAENIEIVFGWKTTSVRYEADTGLYSLREYGADYIDEDTGEKVTFRNVMVLYAKTSVLDDIGHLSVNFTGSGEGYFACGGKYVPITWERDNGCFRYYLTDGSPLEFGVGHTYIAVLPSGTGTVEFE